MNYEPFVKLQRDRAIVVTDITGWTETCYRAAAENKGQELADAFVDFARNTSDVASFIEASAHIAVVGTANHTGDGFIYLSNKVEGVCPIVRKAISRFDCLVEHLKNCGVPLSEDFNLRIALHCGDVYECELLRHCQPPRRRSELVNEHSGTKEPMAERHYLYLGDAINLACKMVSHDIARKYRAVCSPKFLQVADLFRSFSKEHRSTNFDGGYPQDVTIHGLDW